MIKKVLPFVILYIAFLVSAIAHHIFLQSTDQKWILRYLGIAGTLLVIFSFMYSLRKRNVLNFGKAKSLLKVHEVFAWTGALLILTHAGFDFDAVIPRIASFAMLIVVASGITGKYLLKLTKLDLKQRLQEIEAHNLSAEEIDKELFFRSLIADKMQMWRNVHIPLTVIIIAFALLHIITILLFWRW